MILCGARDRRRRSVHLRAGRAALMTPRTVRTPRLAGAPCTSSALLHSANTTSRGASGTRQYLAGSIAFRAVRNDRFSSKALLQANASQRLISVGVYERLADEPARDGHNR